MNDAAPLFLYGTLRHGPLLDVVAAETVALIDAVLPDHAVWRVAEGEFPVLTQAAGHGATGSLAALSPAAIERLDFYEGAYHYVRRPVTVSVDGTEVAAQAYFAPRDRITPSSEPWSLTAWREAHGELTCEAATEAMAHLGLMTPEEMGRRFSAFRGRAWSRLLARGDTPALAQRRAHDRTAVQDLSREISHSGFFSLQTLRLDHPTYAGGRSGEIVREAFVGTDAALILPYDPKSDSVLLVEQFRTGPFVRGDTAPWALEPVAGLVDPGEAPSQTARREAQEEAGLSIDRLIEVFRGYPSPGATTEFYHCFIGICDLAGAGGAGGLADESEDIWSHVIPMDRALDLADSGEVNVIPLVTLLYWLQINRKRLDTLS